MPELFGDGRIQSAIQSGAAGAPIILEGGDLSQTRDFALRLAAGLLCAGQSGTGKPCLACGPCKRVQAGTHPDLHILEYEGKSVKIEQVRELRAKTFIKPHEGEIKVFILIEADRLSDQCQNALLKALEEPQNCAFVLTASDSTSLLPTVRSRCVTYRAGGQAGLPDGAPECRLLAERFAAALCKSELDIFEAASEVEALKREQYPEFLNHLCDQLLGVKVVGDARALAIYEYLCSQREMLPHNPGVAALTGALAAFCGAISVDGAIPRERNGT